MRSVTVPVLRSDDVDVAPVRAESLIEAVAEPPRSRKASIVDSEGLLAHASPARARAWLYTDRGAARLRAEAEGWTDVFFSGRAS